MYFWRSGYFGGNKPTAAMASDIWANSFSENTSASLPAMVSLICLRLSTWYSTGFRKVSPRISVTCFSIGSRWAWFAASAFRYAELPVVSIVLSSVAGWMLGMRNMMITVVAEDFVLMSVAMGLPKRKVIVAAARNAVLPSIANLSLAIGLVVSGALLVELVFNYPGVGDLLLNAVQNEDYPLIQGIFLVITLAVLAANLLADLVYLGLDPRTRTETAT